MTPGHAGITLCRDHTLWLPVQGEAPPGHQGWDQQLSCVTACHCHLQGAAAGVRREAGTVSREIWLSPSGPR